MEEPSKNPLEGTFHRRNLPPPSIPFSSPDGKQIFREALLSGGMEVYFPIAEAFQTQGDPSFCGLGSLTTALNAILLDPQRVWRGVWRWWDEEMLNCCEPLDVVKLKGLSLSKVHCLARCQGAATTLHYANTSTEEEFRNAVIRSCCGDASSSTSSAPVVIICSYLRKVLKQTGTGHFSPIGGYHAEKDLVLIMDVARFKYAPHWVPLSVLFTAMNTTDSDNGMSRGWMTVTSSEDMNTRFSQGCCASSKTETSEEKEVGDATTTDTAGDVALPREDKESITKRIHDLVDHKCSKCCGSCS